MCFEVLGVLVGGSFLYLPKQGSEKECGVPSHRGEGTRNSMVLSEVEFCLSGHLAVCAVCGEIIDQSAVSMRRSFDGSLIGKTLKVTNGINVISLLKHVLFSLCVIWWT